MQRLLIQNYRYDRTPSKPQPMPPDSCGDEIYAILQDGVLELHFPRKLPPDENGKSNIIPFEEPHYECTPS